RARAAASVGCRKGAQRGAGDPVRSSVSPHAPPAGSPLTGDARMVDGGLSRHGGPAAGLSARRAGPHKGGGGGARPVLACAVARGPCQLQPWNFLASKTGMIGPRFALVAFFLI